MKRTPILLESLPRGTKKTHIPRMDLETIFDHNIVEVCFRRRDLTKVLGHNKESRRGGKQWHVKKRPIGHKNFYRRMLCTRNFRYISSPLTRKLYKWKKPKKRRGKAWYRKRGLLIVWDIMQNEWRMISITGKASDMYVITGVTSIADMSDRDEFTEWYRQHIKYLAKNRKNSFSDTAK